jgi:hypothetical protein
LTATAGTFTSGLVGTTGTFSGALSATTGTFSGAVDIQGQELILDADNDTSITADTDDTIDFKVAGTDKIRIDSSGRFLLGPTTAEAMAPTTTPQVQIEGTNHNTSALSIFRNSNDNGQSLLILGKSRGTSVGADTVVQDDDNVGEILFTASDGSDRTPQVASVRAAVDGTPGSNDMPGRLEFYTTADGAQTITKRMQINSDGRVGIGVVGEAGVKVEINAGADGAVALSARSDGGNGNNRRFNILADASGNGTYGGGLTIQTRKDDNNFANVMEYSAYQQEIFHGAYRRCNVSNQYGNGKYFYSNAESGTFSNAGNGVANAQTAGTNLNYQGIQVVCVKVYYSSDSALMHETFATICNQYHNSGITTQMTHNGTGTIDSVSLSLSGGYSTRRLVVTLDPQASYPASNFVYSITYGYNLN